LTHQKIQFLVDCYLDLRENRISEPEFTNWLNSLSTVEDLTVLNELLHEDAGVLLLTQ
jgi:hypothetical protein